MCVYTACSSLCSGLYEFIGVCIQMMGCWSKFSFVSIENLVPLLCSGDMLV